MIPLTPGMYYRIAAVMVLLATLLGTHWKAYVAGENKIRSEMAMEIIVAADKARRETIELQKQSEDTLNEKVSKLQKLNTDANVIINRLRSDRPSRTTVVASAPTCPETSCTGAGLFAEDGIFLIGEATAANRIVADLMQCQKQYNDVRKKLNAK